MIADPDFVLGYVLVIALSVIAAVRFRRARLFFILLAILVAILPLVLAGLILFLLGTGGHLG